MKKLKGWYSWSNSVVTLYYLEQDKEGFSEMLYQSVIEGLNPLIAWSVAIKDNEDGVMGRTSYGEVISEHPIRSELDLTNLCKRLRQ